MQSAQPQTQEEEEQQQEMEYLLGLNDPRIPDQQGFVPQPAPAWTSTVPGMADEQSLFDARAKSLPQGYAVNPPQAPVVNPPQAPFVNYQSTWTPTPEGGLEGRGNYSEYLKQFENAGQDVSPARWLSAIRDVGLQMHNDEKQKQAEIDREQVFENPKLAASVLEAEARANGVQQAAIQRGNASVQAAQVRAASAYRPTKSEVRVMPDGSMGVFEHLPDGSTKLNIVASSQGKDFKKLNEDLRKSETALIKAKAMLTPTTIGAAKEAALSLISGAQGVVNYYKDAIAKAVPTLPMGGSSTNIFSPTTNSVSAVVKPTSSWTPERVSATSKKLAEIQQSNPDKYQAALDYAIKMGFPTK